MTTVTNRTKPPSTGNSGIPPDDLDELDELDEVDEVGGVVDVVLVETPGP